MVRDQALALSGLLSRKMGGPSRLPAAARRASGRRPSTASGPGRPATGEDRYRRGLYTFWRRTVPYPSMATFDAPSRELCTVRRVRTNTPLQAFVTLNDPVYVEAAQALARRIVRGGGLDAGGPGPVRPAALPGPARRTRGRSRSSPSSSHASSTATAANADAATALATEPLGPLPAGHGPRRAGRLDGGGQRAAEPRRRADEGADLMDLYRAGRHGPRPAVNSSRTRRRAWGPSPCSALLGRAGQAADGRTSSANPLTPRPPHFAPKAKHVIYLHMSGAPPQHDLFDYKPEAGQAPHAALPRRAARRTSGSRSSRGIPSCSARRTSSSSTARAGAWVSELLPAHRRASPTTSPSSSRCRPTSSTTPRPSCSCYTGSPRAGGAAMGSWITYGLGSENQDLPGFVVLISGGTDPTGGKALWSTGFLPSRLPGRAVPHRRRPDPLRQQPQGHGPRRPPPQPRRPAAAQRDRARAVRRPRDADADQPVRAGLPHADGRARGDGHPPGAARRPRRSTAPSRATASFANNCLLARRLVERGVRYVQLYDWGWDMPRHRHGRRHRRPPAQEVQGDRPAGRGPAERPEAARPARRDAGHLGRRVRPHVDERGARRLEVPRPRPPPALLHDLDGRRRDQGGRHLRRDRRAGLSRSPRTRRPSTTSRRRSCTCWASTPGSSPTPTRASTSG